MRVAYKRTISSVRVWGTHGRAAAELTAHWDAGRSWKERDWTELLGPWSGLQCRPPA